MVRKVCYHARGSAFDTGWDLQLFVFLDIVELCSLIIKNLSKCRESHNDRLQMGKVRI